MNDGKTSSAQLSQRTIDKVLAAAKAASETDAKLVEIRDRFWQKYGIDLDRSPADDRQ